mmetsp:Transcript_27293/g.54596  ORF Transcript_27293/g.54596 Transcript_27293/m.54596 type:complete len:348 (+) Transcript_27293:43-1086(+)
MRKFVFFLALLSTAVVFVSINSLDHKQKTPQQPVFASTIAPQPLQHTDAPQSTHRCDGIYSKLRGDRGGSVIRNMLLHSFHAFKSNTTYCGGCGHRSPSIAKMLTAIGLNEVLPLLKIKCLEDVTVHSGTNATWMDRIKIDSGEIVSEAFSNWRNGLTKNVYMHTLSEETEKASCKISVHVRRGDLDPSTAAKWSERLKYLPNAYYLDLIDRELSRRQNKLCSVVIHTEEAYFMMRGRGKNTGGRSKNTAPTEDNDEFRRRNYTVVVGGREEVAWRDFIDCDVFIASKSSFSFVPAIFSRGTVIFPVSYNAWPIYVMPDWILAPTDPYVKDDQDWKIWQKKSNESKT